MGIMIVVELEEKIITLGKVVEIVNIPIRNLKKEKSGKKVKIFFDTDDEGKVEQAMKKIEKEFTKYKKVKQYKKNRAKVIEEEGI